MRSLVAGWYGVRVVSLGRDIERLSDGLRLPLFNFRRFFFGQKQRIAVAFGALQRS